LSATAHLHSPVRPASHFPAHVGHLGGHICATESSTSSTSSVNRLSGSPKITAPAATAWLTEIRAQLQGYLGLIADGWVQVPFRTFPLSGVPAAWTTSAESGPRVLLVRD